MRQSVLTLAVVLACIGATAVSTLAAVHADIDRDGRVDVVRVEASPARVTVVLGDSPRPLVLPAIDRVTTVTLSDVDGDGDLDIVGLSDHYGILLWRNTGHGRFVETRPTGQRLVLRHAVQTVRRARAATSDPDSVFSETERLAIRQATFDCFRASVEPWRAPPVPGTRPAAAVPRSSRAPPPPHLS